MPDHPRKLLVIGAHPDDAEVRAGGLALLYRRQGHRVRFVSTTNGDAGHHALDRAALAKRRAEEARRVTERSGIEYEILPLHDGELEPTLENRFTLIRLIRRYQPDLVLTHRPNDYHPDHRYTSILVQDAAFSITVPHICEDTPALARNPVILYLADRFTDPTPFRPDVAVGIDEIIEAKMDLLDCHASQFYEWLPYLAGTLDQVPEDATDRRQFLDEHWLGRSEAQPWRDALVRFYGPDRGKRIRFAEAFMASEYGASLDAAGRQTLFPFLPAVRS